MTNYVEVSVCILSYNYENYIAQCLESVLIQRCNFSFEIVIADDLSKDDTRRIINSYYDRYPKIIKLSFNEENIGGTKNWIKAINACSGKYIALLDGDDYFTDSFKLQKQYDCLENNLNSNICFHAVEEIYDDKPSLNKITKSNKAVLTVEDLIKGGWFIRTSSTFFRNGILPLSPPSWVFKYPYRYDSIIHILLTLNGNCIYLNEVMSVWRKHSSGISNIFIVDSTKNLLDLINLEEDLNLFTQNRFKPIFEKNIRRYKTGIVMNLIKSGKCFIYPGLFIKSIIGMEFLHLLKVIKFKLFYAKKTKLGQ